MNRSQVQQIIPHRPPFLFIDEVLELEPGTRAVGIRDIRHDEHYLTGHFPGMPIMPGVLIIEAMAQLGAVALLSLPEYQGRIAYFAGINKARFRRKVFPGERLTLEVKVKRRMGPMGIGEATASVDGEMAAEAEIMFSVGDESTG